MRSVLNAMVLSGVLLVAAAPCRFVAAQEPESPEPELVRIPFAISAGGAALPPSVFITGLARSPALLTKALEGVKAKAAPGATWHEARQEWSNMLVLRVQASGDREFEVGTHFVLHEELEGGPGELWGIVSVGVRPVKHAVAAPDSPGGGRASDDVTTLEADRKFCHNFALFWIAELDAALSEFADDKFKGVREALGAKLDMASELVSVAEAKLQALRNELERALSGNELPVEIVEQQLATAATERQSLELELVGLRVRNEHLEAELANQAERFTSSVDQDVAIQKLTASIRDYQEQIQDVEVRNYSKEMATKAESVLARLRDSLKQAQADLVEARRAEAKVPSKDLLERLQSDLVDTVVSLRECEAKMRLLEERVAEYRDMLQHEMGLRSLREQLRGAEAAADAARAELSRAKQEQLGSVRVDVSIRTLPRTEPYPPAEPAPAAEPTLEAEPASNTPGRP